MFCRAPLAENGIRAGLRNRSVRVRIPGGVPRFCRRRVRIRLLFYNWMWQSDPRRAFQRALISPSRRAAGWAGLRSPSAGIAQQGRSRRWREFEPRLPVAMFPSSNGQDGGLSSRRCRFNSGRECQPGCSSVDRAIALQAKDAGLNPAVSTNSSRCSAAGQRAPFGTARPQVRILPARPTIPQ